MFLGAINYTQELPKIVDTLNLIENRTNLVKDVNAWIEPFRDFVSVYYEKGESNLQGVINIYTINIV